MTVYAVFEEFFQRFRRPENECRVSAHHGVTFFDAVTLLLDRQRKLPFSTPHERKRNSSRMYQRLLKLDDESLTAESTFDLFSDFFRVPPQTEIDPEKIAFCVSPWDDELAWIPGDLKSDDVLSNRGNHVYEILGQGTLRDRDVLSAAIEQIAGGDDVGTFEAIDSHRSAALLRQIFTLDADGIDRRFPKTDSTLAQSSAWSIVEGLSTGSKFYTNAAVVEAPFRHPAKRIFDSPGFAWTNSVAWIGWNRQQAVWIEKTWGGESE